MEDLFSVNPGIVDELGRFHADESLDAELKDLFTECYYDTGLFAKTFFPEEVPLKFTDLHYEILNAMDKAHDKSKIVIAAPRGIGKTTLSAIYVAKHIVYRISRFVCYISKTETHAMQQTEYLKELLIDSNRSVLFGDIRSRDVKGPKDFSKKSWVANNYTAVVPRGATQQIRGLKWRKYRIDLFVFDDLEDDILVRNEEQRMTLKKWFFGAAIKAHSMDSPWKMIYIDTIKHEDALIVDLLNLPTWEHVKLSACTDDYKTLVPEFISQEELNDEIEEHRTLGLMDVFLRERMCRVVNEETAVFKQSYFKYYDESELKQKLLKGMIINFVLVDPAKSATPSSSDVAIAVVGVDYNAGCFYIRDIVNGKLHPDETYNTAIDLAARYKAVAIGVEVTGLNEFVTYPFMDTIIRRSRTNGRVFRLIELKARKGQGEFAGVGGGKKGRITALLPYYRTGLVYHNKSATAVLEQQLLSFPHSKKVDVVDCVSYIVELMSIMNQYFGGDTDDYDQLTDDEFKEIEDDDYEVAYDDSEVSVIEYELPSVLRQGGLV